MGESLRPGPLHRSGQAADGEEVRFSVCPHDCWDTCAMRVYVRDGVVQRVTGDPDHPVTRGYLCVKVSHYEERIYSPDRVLYPMRRTGPKGSMSFERIPWADALATIAARFRAVIAEHGPEAILPYSYAGTIGLLQFGSMDRRFFHALGASQLGRTICSAAGEVAMFATNGAKLGPDPEDFIYSKLIVVWGLNAVSSNTHQVPILREARRRGATVVVVDPYRNATARLADWHISPRPGTDTALVLGMMHVILAEGLQDQAYIDQHTVGFADLASRVREWRPERAAAVTGLDAGEIRRFARVYATTQPAVLRTGYGMQRQTNGGTAIRAVACLPALTGAWRHRGGGFLLSNSGSYGFDMAALHRPDLMPDPRPREINMNQLGRALTGLDAPPVKALMVYNCNPAGTAPNQNHVIRGLSREDLFTVVHEQLFTDTCRYADIVLPATTQLECFDLMYSYWHLYVMLNEPAIAPLGESVSNTELFRRLARAMGLTHPCLTDTDEEMARQALAGSPALAHITLERLRAEKWVKVERDPAPFAGGVFPTPSGKIELYSAALAAQGLDPVIGYIPAAESPDGAPELAARYPLQLVSPGAHHFLNTSFANLPAMLKGEKMPTVYLSPEDAAARGVADGDWVRLHNDRGEVWVKARLGDWSRPGVAVSPTLWWNRLSPGDRNLNALTTDQLADYGGGAAFHTNLVQAEKVSPERAGELEAEFEARTGGSLAAGLSVPVPGD